MPPFFLFYGGKWAMAKALGRPRLPCVIEPFAGSAGYSVYWEPPKVILIERDPVIFGIWDYLVHATPAEILALPIVDELSELPAAVPPAARNLIGFWFNRATTTPSQRRSNWARPLPGEDDYIEDVAADSTRTDYSHYFWSAHIRKRIAKNVGKIKHWKVIHGNWQRLPHHIDRLSAHWHIDPPYAVAGQHYKFNAIDYRALGLWCRSRKGFIQVCENSGADWLPFADFGVFGRGKKGKTRKRSSHEVVYESEDRPRDFF